MAEPGDASAYFDHMMRHFAESGSDGDFHFHPVLDFKTWVRAEHVAKTVAAWNLPVGEMGWQRAWVAEMGGEIVADAMLRSGLMSTTQHRCQFGIGLERSARGQGLGRRLSLQAIAWAKQQDSLAWMDLWVFSHNAPAIALYDTLGFVRVGEVRDQFRLGREKIDNRHMVLSLAR